MTTFVTPELLQALLSPDGNVRSHAEAVYQNLNVLDRISGLVPQLTTTTTGQQQQQQSCCVLAAVLLRRDIVKLSSSQHLQELLVPLLHALDSNDKVGYCLAEVCASLTLVQPEAVSGALTTILTHIQGSCQAGNVASLHLLASLAEKAPMPFTPLAVDSLATLYHEGWSPAAMAAWMRVLLKAALATTVTSSSSSSSDFVTSITNLDALRVDATSLAARLAPCVVPLLEWLSVATNSTTTGNPNNHDSIHSILQDLQQACVTVPSLIASNPTVLAMLVHSCLQVAMTTAATTSELALAALQVLSSLISVGDVKRRFLTSDLVGAMVSQALPLCAQLLSAHAGDEHDDRGWAEEPAMLHDGGMDDDEDDEYLFALSLLEDFLLSLGALGHVLPLAEQLLSSHPRVGLSVLDVALSAAPVGLTPHVPVVLQAAITLASSSTNPRVQYQALRVLGSLCESHAEHLPSETIPIILEQLAGAVRSPCTKLSTMASLGFVSVARNDLLAEYLPPLLPQILDVLIHGPLSCNGTDTGSLAVRVRAVGAIATLAQACGAETFEPFYSRIMAGLMPMVLNTTGPLIDLSSASLEAATIIGQAVGKDIFERDAHQLLQWMMPLLQQQSTTSTTNTNSGLMEAMLLACARMASVLEDDFSQYVHVVVPLLLQRIQESPDVSIAEGTETDDNSGDAGTESMTVAIPGRGFTKVTINTTKIQEQAQAARALYEHAKAMGASFPYIQQSLDALLPLVNFPYSSDVRSTCAQTLGAVMDAASMAGDQHGNMDLVRTYLPPIVLAIAKQISLEDGTTDMEALYALADSLSEVYYSVYRNRKTRPEILMDFGLAHAESSVQNCIVALTSCLERRSQITLVLSGALAGEDEKQDYIEQLESEQQLLTPLVDSIGYPLKFFGTAFLPIFEKHILSVLGPKMEDQSDVRATLAAVCLFDDVVEHCGPDAAATYAPRLMQAVATTLEQHSNEKELVQASVYGIAQMARHAPSGVLSGHLQAIIHRLLALTSRCKDEAGDDVYLVEIAASALASVTLLGPFPDVKYVPQQTLIDSFLSQLPILQDDDEGKICHAGFCHLIESGTISLSQESVRVAKIIGDILVQVHEGEDIASPDTVERLSSILYHMQQSLTPTTLQQAFEAMDADAQQIAASILQEMGVSRKRVVTP